MAGSDKKKTGLTILRIPALIVVALVVMFVIAALAMRG